MRLRTALTLATVFVVCFTIAAWSTPVPDRLIPVSPSASPDNASLSGKIASISDAAFSLEITKNQERKVIEFQVDGDTKIEGKLAVGSQATVEYRSNGSSNIAVRVVVTPASGIGGY
ncbi:MAG TPA: hypothetical protein VMH48_10015 [Methylomirabilota bacterium]|nr:hypothetical protein [Methylomirabilota bacterium]